MSAVVTLYRPVGVKELELIRQSGWTKFPPRLPGQPIFYPVVQEQYAIEIARDWNATRGGAGFVTRFGVDATWLSQFDVHFVGGRDHAEFWIPAERLEEFNSRRRIHRDRRGVPRSKLTQTMPEPYATAVPPGWAGAP